MKSFITNTNSTQFYINNINNIDRIFLIKQITSHEQHRYVITCEISEWNDLDQNNNDIKFLIGIIFIDSDTYYISYNKLNNAVKEFNKMTWLLQHRRI